MSSRQKLTQRVVGAAEAPAEGYVIIWDTDVKGFGLRVLKPSDRHPKGARAFILNYRTEAGTERRITIGDAADWSAEDARKEASALKRRVDQGADPVAERKAARAGETVRDLCNVYLARAESKAGKKGGLSPRHVAEQRARMERIIIPRLGARKLADVGPADVKRLHSQMSETPTMANHVHSDLRRLFNLASELVGFDGPNPAEGVERYTEEPRKRYLTPEELRRLLTTLDGWKDRSVANLVRLAILTGARRGELFKATWGQFDLQSGIWTKPAATTKTKTLHDAPISPEAVALLAAIRPAHAKPSDLVFPGRGRDADGREQPLDTIKRSWASVCKAAGVAELRFHDLRHSFASFLASGGVSLPMIGGLLGHSNPKTTARYAHLLREPLREATARVGALVTAIGEGKNAQVVPLRKGSAA